AVSPRPCKRIHYAKTNPGRRNRGTYTSSEGLARISGRFSYTRTRNRRTGGIMTVRSIAAALLGVLLTSVPAPARQDSIPDPKQIELFDSKVRPLLSARCFKCHSAEAPK